MFYSKVEDNVTVTIHLDHVLEFSVGDSGAGVGERCREFQPEADASLTHETEVVLFAEICGEIERIQSVSVGIVFATDVQPFVFAEFASSGKHAVVGSYIESVPVVGLYGSHGVLLLTVQVHRNLVQIKVLEIEGILLTIAVVCAIVDQSDHDARGQLTGKQFLVTDVEIIRGIVKDLHTTRRIGYFAGLRSRGLA